MTPDSQTPPADWKQVPLASVANISFSNVDKKSSPSEDPVRLCNYIDVYNNDYITGDLPFMHATATKSETAKFGLLVGDVIITKDSETPDDIGIPAVVDKADSDLVCGYHLALIRPKRGAVDPTFLGNQIGHPRVARYFGRMANGLTRYGLPTRAIEETPVWLPPTTTEQNLVGENLRLLDGAIRETEAVVAKLRQVKAGLLHDLLTRGLDEHGHLRDPARHPEQFQDSPLGQIPRSWEVISLSRYTQSMTSGSRFWAAYYAQDGPLFLRIGNLTREHINLRFDDLMFVQPPPSSEALRTRAQPGDLLISITADLARCHGSRPRSSRRGVCESAHRTGSSGARRT